MTSGEGLMSPFRLRGNAFSVSRPGLIHRATAGVHGVLRAECCGSRRTSHARDL